MYSSISSLDKINFVSWIFNFFKNQKRSDVLPKEFFHFFMNLSNEETLDQIKFVEYVEDCPLSATFSSKNFKKTGFESFKNGEVFSYNSKEVAYFLRNNPNEIIYVQLNFPEINDFDEYGTILEKNPYLIEAEKISEHILYECLFQFKEKNLLEEIDLTLLRKDKEEFFRLTKLLKELRNSVEYNKIV